MSAAVPLRLDREQPFPQPLVGLVSINLAEANALLEVWEHYLGGCDRPFRNDGWALDGAGEPIAVATSSSIVGDTAAGYPQCEVVELSRLCVRPGEEWATRVMPRLAVARGDARFVFTLGIASDGSVSFTDRLQPWWNYRSGYFDLKTGFALPAEFVWAHPSGERVNAWTQEAWAAQVPMVPPAAREKAGLAVNANMRSYVVLWEADDWRWMRDPAPTRDPALLRHVAGDIYAVLATWDLTEIERLVLSGRSIAEARI